MKRDIEKRCKKLGFLLIYIYVFTDCNIFASFSSSAIQT